MKKRLFTIAILTASVLSLSVSCSDDFVDREFHQSVEQAPLKNLQEIQAFVKGAYASMRSTNYYGADYLAFGEVRSDKMYSNLAGGYYQNIQNYTMLSTDAYATNTWNKIYEMIAKTNIVINSDVAAFTGTDTDKSRSYYSQGQAYGLRAIGFFDLLRLYGQKYTGGNLGVVLPTKYDPKAKMARATIAETEAQIVADFDKALALMSTNTPLAISGKTDLSIPALKALMSRFYLYKGDYAKVRQLTNELAAAGYAAPISAGLVKESFNYTLNGAASNSIFELAVGQVASLGTTSYGYRLQYGGYANIQPKKDVVESLYANNDVRKTLFTEFPTKGNGNWFISGKYTNGSGNDNIKMVRNEEVLLNGVEAELNGGSPIKALDYYKTLLRLRLLPIKNADGSEKSVEDQLLTINSVTMDDLKKERSRELIGEGQRQWDLLRWGDKSFVPASVDKNLIAFPIPRAEINIVDTKIVQNPGYEK
ncbi:RagB/SusD family nutrient uptake outer membrane protein [Empedobacter sedimenti]|uniref:RagB/SusD family nutrient uptake outer membrane protein n=1 Tax=Empedobacter sedimenti TaxID=3042610 RepID=UPI0024A628C4|nr:RagB/SusD family nutrient uptake outer membrane protein [Empedobacter sedimenti]